MLSQRKKSNPTISFCCCFSLTWQEGVIKSKKSGGLGWYVLWHNHKSYIYWCIMNNAGDSCKTSNTPPPPAPPFWLSWTEILKSLLRTQSLLMRQRKCIHVSWMFSGILWQSSKTTENGGCFVQGQDCSRVLLSYMFLIGVLVEPTKAKSTNVLEKPGTLSTDIKTNLTSWLTRMFRSYEYSFCPHHRTLWLSWDWTASHKFHF